MATCDRMAGCLRSVCGVFGGGEEEEPSTRELGLDKDPNALNARMSRIPICEDNLLEAVLGGQVDDVKAALAAGADVNMPDQFDRTALMFAAANGNVDIAEVLLEAGAKVNASQPPAGDTALMMAAVCGFKAVAEVLLEARADPSITSSEGNTALEFAERSGHRGVIRLLGGKPGSILRTSRRSCEAPATAAE
mmetsp:Transcript_50394/g.156225  ORF Transcript_50394/g.156225 Transcript_50394/m.156225 type:complete len:193 (+) Transcript_50394:62-640(+)